MINGIWQFLLCSPVGMWVFARSFWVVLVAVAAVFYQYPRLAKAPCPQGEKWHVSRLMVPKWRLSEQGHSIEPKPKVMGERWR